jgi:hypothetical protein
LARNNPACASKILGQTLGARKTWLAGSPEEAFALAREFPPDRNADCAGRFGKEDLVIAA